MSAKDVAEAIDGLLSSSLGPERVREHESHWSADLWQQLVDLGMTAVDVPVPAGGGGGTLEEALEVARLCGYHNANLPIVDAGLVGSWLRGTAGLPLAQRPDAVALDERGALEFDGTGDGLRITGDVELPWGRACGELLVLREAGAGTRLVRVPGEVLANATWTHDRNLGGEPRDRVILVKAAGVEVVGFGVSISHLQARRGLGVATLMLGALEKVVDLAVEQVRTREQFGRRLGSFQVIQHYLATMVAELATVRAAVAHAASGVSPNGLVDIDAAGAAKIRAGAAAEVITQLGHQVHGAIGVTEEHELGLSTRRLWAWRDEHGDEQYWSRLLGRSIASRAYTAGLWSVLAPVT